MPLFKCSKCGVIENTATTSYWFDVHCEGKPALCSECHPDIGVWHGEFKRTLVSDTDLVVGSDGLLHQPNGDIA
jgi:hypothetical protein